MINIKLFSIVFSIGIASGNAAALEGSMTVLAQAGATSKSQAASVPAKVAKTITEDEAKKLALQAVPGKVIDVAIEKKKGADRYVVEVVPAKGGKEVDVIIHMTTGKILAIEN
jgi:uncharacterized membrane protein YkoI